MKCFAQNIYDLHVLYFLTMISDPSISHFLYSILQQLFVAEPAEVVFTDYHINQTYEVQVLHNYGRNF